MKNVRNVSWMFFVVAGCVVSGALFAGAPKSKEASWSNQMRMLYGTLADVLTDVSSDKRFLDPANRSRIEREAAKLARLSHDLGKKNMTAPDGDPTLRIISGLLERESQRAATELKRNNRAYARSVLRSIPGYCIACHTRNSTGPEFSKLPIEPTDAGLSALEKGEFFAASRQFDRAQGEFKSVILDHRAMEASIWDWERAVRQSLAIAVRVKKDPVQAQEIVQAVLATENAPWSIREDAKTWKTSLQEWQNELPRQAVTEDGLYAEAVRLMARARETQKYPMDRGADILYLRVSSLIHDLLQTAPTGTHAAEAFLMAGLSYEVLDPLKTDKIHEIYYEACVRGAPHTTTAELCYRRYEDSVVFGFTGSAGVSVPADARQRLQELRDLSRTESNPRK